MFFEEKNYLINLTLFLFFFLSALTISASSQKRKCENEILWPLDFHLNFFLTFTSLFASRKLSFPGLSSLRFMAKL